MKIATNTDKGIMLQFSDPERQMFYEMVNSVKSIPGSSFHPKLKCWYLPLSKSNIETIINLGFEISPALEAFRKKGNFKINFNDKRLRDYQNAHCQNLIKILQENHGALDGSDTGTGKTYCALAIAEYLKMIPIILTPKSVVSVWYQVSKLFNVKDKYANNYEQYRNNNSPYLKVGFKYVKDKKGQQVEKKTFNWQVPNNAILIFDEAHRCKDYKTQNSEMLEAAVDKNLMTLCLSATIADNPLQFYSVGKAIRLFTDKIGFLRWALTRGVQKGFWTRYEFPSSESHRKKFLPKIHKDIYPSRGSRMAIKDLGDKFPKNLIITDCYNMGANAERIRELQRGMRMELDRLNRKKKGDKDSSLVEVIRMRQEIELLKVPTFIELTADHLEEGHSVPIFVNFTETLNALARRLDCKCIVDGSVTGLDRDRNIERFQSDQERIIILNIKAGGVGISLHDLNGKYPRVGLISPTYSAQDLIQALGRLPREGAKSNVIQKIIFCADTIEEEVALKVAKKVENINMINMGDLNGI